MGISLAALRLRQTGITKYLIAAVLTWAVSAPVWGQNYTLGTVAGRGLPDGVPATAAGVAFVSGVTTDAAGNLYFSAQDYDAVYRRESNGLLTRVAGNGKHESSGDGGPAIAAGVAAPRGIALDSAGNLYVAEMENPRVRKISNGVVTTVAGGGFALGDNGPAASAQLKEPLDVAVDAAGNLYIADGGDHRIRMVSNGVITTIAGNGTQGYGGDNGPATSAQINYPTALAVDSAGNLYIADSGNNRIRKVSGGVITTVAGDGTRGYGGDGGPATSARLAAPAGVEVDSAGNLYIADLGNLRVRKVANGLITTIAGTGSPGYAGDNGPATSAQMEGPLHVASDAAGNLYIADGIDHRIRQVSGGVITTAVGNGSFGYSGDNGPAADAQLDLPWGVAVDAAGSVYIADYSNYRVRKVSGGNITTVAGNGVYGFSGDNGAATDAKLRSPAAVAVDAGGSLYIADYWDHRVRKVSNGVITTVAGNGGSGSAGDNGPATSASLSKPSGAAVDAAGNLYIADASNNRIRKVSNGVITTFAGGGTTLGDNGPAVNAKLSGPVSVALDSAGNLYIADTGNHRIRKVSNGVITTVAGNGTYGFSGDDGPAVGAQLYQPTGVAVDAAGNIFIVDRGNYRIRRVSNGKIFTIGGNGTSGFSGDGSPANAGQFIDPFSVAVDSAGIVYVSDRSNHRIRSLTPGGPSLFSSVSAASFAAELPLTPGQIAAGFGRDMALTVEIAPAAGPLPTELAQTSVLVKDSAGDERAAPLWFVAPTQINYLVPAETALGPAAVTVTRGGQTVAIGTLQIEAVSPGLFTMNANGMGVPAALAIFVKPGPVQTWQYVFNAGCLPGSCLPAPIDLGAATDTVYLQLYGTGIRGRRALSGVSVMIGNAVAPVSYAGPVSGFVGLDQVNVRVPRSLIGRGQVDLLLYVDGKFAPPVQVNIK